MGVFPQKRSGEGVCTGGKGRLCTVQKGKEGQIFVEKSAELRTDSAGALAEYGEKVKEKLGG